jgi:hypothetical protein
LGAGAREPNALPAINTIITSAIAMIIPLPLTILGEPPKGAAAGGNGILLFYFILFSYSSTIPIHRHKHQIVQPYPQETFSSPIAITF